MKKGQRGKRSGAFYYLLVSVLQMGPETIWLQSPFYFLRHCHFAKHSDVSLEQDYFVSESKDSSYYCIGTPLLVKTTLWIIPISYLLKVPHLLSMTIDSLWRT